MMLIVQDLNPNRASSIILLCRDGQKNDDDTTVEFLVFRLSKYYTVDGQTSWQ
jgi:hypothetical protein